MSIVRGLQRAWLAYTNSLGKRPFLVPSIQTSFLLGMGDALSQQLIEDHSKPYDYLRTARFSAMGLLVGPGLRAWYGVLDRVVGRETGLRPTLKKVALDQLVFSPVMLGVFMATLSTLEGKSLQEFRQTLSLKYMDILIANYQIWPPVQLLNFTLVPLQFRVLLVQVVALGWNTYLAWKLHKAPVKLAQVKGPNK